MQPNEILQQIGGIGAMARELGVSETQAASGVEALLPAILGGFKRQAQAHPAGLDGLGAALSQLGGGGLLEEVLAPAPVTQGSGSGLDALLGGGSAGGTAGASPLAGLGSLLDLNGDGNPLDDILRMAGSALR